MPPKKNRGIVAYVGDSKRYIPASQKPKPVEDMMPGPSTSIDLLTTGDQGERSKRVLELTESEIELTQVKKQRNHLLANSRQSNTRLPLLPTPNQNENRSSTTPKGSRQEDNEQTPQEESRQQDHEQTPQQDNEKELNDENISESRGLQEEEEDDLELDCLMDVLEDGIMELRGGEGSDTDEDSQSNNSSSQNNNTSQNYARSSITLLIKVNRILNTIEIMGIFICFRVQILAIVYKCI